MSKAKFDAARELVRERKYTEARAILRTIDHPQATAWLAKIDQIDPPKVAPINPIEPLKAKPVKRSKRKYLYGCLFVALIGLAATGLWFRQYAQEINEQVKVTLTAMLFTVKATVSTPIPAKVSQEQANEMLTRCVVGGAGNLGKAWADSTDKDIANQNFAGMGIGAHIYLRNSGCSQAEIFQIIWESYTRTNDILLRQNMDKGVAWTKFLEGWQFSINSDIQSTATAAAFKAKQPTEVMATN